MLINYPVALRKAKTLQSFGRSECSRVKHRNLLFLCWARTNCRSSHRRKHMIGSARDKTLHTQIIGQVYTMYTVFCSVSDVWENNITYEVDAQSET